MSEFDEYIPPEYFSRIHRHLFQVIFKHARQYRNYDITKRAFQSAKMAL